MQTKDPNLTKTPKETTVDNTVDYDKSTETVDTHTSENKGTTTLDKEAIDSKHVNAGDNPARQPDRRDQKGETPFDGNVNTANSETNENPQSDEITDMNRYATVDNAQTRVLNEDLK